MCCSATAVRLSIAKCGGWKITAALTSKRMKSTVSKEFGCRSNQSPRGDVSHPWQLAFRYQLCDQIGRKIDIAVFQLVGDFLQRGRRPAFDHRAYLPRHINPLAPLAMYQPRRWG